MRYQQIDLIDPVPFFMIAGPGLRAGPVMTTSRTVAMIRPKRHEAHPIMLWRDHMATTPVAGR